MARTVVFQRSLDAITKHINTEATKNVAIEIKQEPREDIEEISKKTEDSSIEVSETQNDQTISKNNLFNPSLHKDNIFSKDNLRNEKYSTKSFKSVINNKNLEIPSIKTKTHLNSNTKTPLLKEILLNGKYCPVCFVKIKSIRQYEMHKYIYDTSKPYNLCSTCNINFSYNSRLSNHLKTAHDPLKHSSNVSKFFMCNFCYQKFNYKHTLQSHLFHYHKDNFMPELDANITINETINKNAKYPRNKTSDLHSDNLTKVSSPNGNSPSEKKLRQTTIVEFMQVKDVNDKSTSSSISSNSSSKNTRSVLNKYKRKSCDIVKNTDTNIHKALTKFIDTSVNVSDESAQKVGSSLKRQLPTQNNTPNKKCKVDKPFVEIHILKKEVMNLIENDWKFDGLRTVFNLYEESQPQGRRTREKRNFLNSSSDLHDTNNAIKSSICKKNKNQIKNIQPNATIRTRSLRNLSDTELCRIYNLSPCKVMLNRCDKELSINNKNKENQVMEVVVTNDLSDSTIDIKNASTIASNLSENVPNNSKEVPDNSNDIIKSASSYSIISSPESLDSISNASTSKTQYNIRLKDIEIPLVRINPIHKEKANISDDEVPLKNKLYECKICEYKCDSKEQRKWHLAVIHTAYMSSICKTRFTMKSKLVEHYYRIHTPRHSVECCVCKETFSDRTALKCHLLLHCIKIFIKSMESEFLNDESKCEFSVKKYKCVACNKRFRLKVCFEEHRKVCKVWTNMMQVDSGPETNKIICSTPNNDDANTNNNINETAINSNEETLSSNITKNLTVYSDHLYAMREEDQSDSSNLNIVEETVNNNDLTINIKNCALLKQKEKHPCGICGKQFMSSENLYKHMRLYYEAKNIICEICNTCFPTKRHLSNHFKKTHGSDSLQIYRVYCQYCKEGFNRRGRAREHEMHIHGHQILTELMPMVSSNLNTNDNQSINNKQSSEKTMTCTVCNVAFSNYDHFIQHNTYYFSGNIVACTLCKKNFSGMFLFHHHNKLNHFTEELRASYTYRCEICQEGFRKELHFYSHQVHVHKALKKIAPNEITNIDGSPNIMTTKKTDLPTYICDICNVHFSSPQELNTHQMEFSLKGHIKCYQCKNRYSSLAIMEKHYMLNHKGKNVSAIKCDICSEILADISALFFHKKHFHNNQLEKLSTALTNTLPHQKPIENNVLNVENLTPITVNLSIMCEICGRHFKVLDDLNQHLKNYINFGEFQCTTCQRKFLNHDDLTVHMDNHANAMTNFKYHCCICQENFNDISDVTSHSFHLHNKETFENLRKKEKINLNVLQSKIFGNEFNGNNLDNIMLMVNKNFISSVNANPSDNNLSNINLSELLNIQKETFDVAEITTNSTKNMFQVDTTSTNKTQNRCIECNTCNLKFSSQNNLMNHWAHFANTGDYVCEICGKRFPWNAVFQEHYTRHQIEKGRDFKHKCSFCNEKFESSNLVHAHIVHVHNQLENKNLEKSIVKVQTKPITKDKSVISQEMIANSKTVEENNELISTTDNLVKSNSSVQNNPEIIIVEETSDVEIIEIHDTNKQDNVCKTTSDKLIKPNNLANNCVKLKNENINEQNNIASSLNNEDTRINTNIQTESNVIHPSNIIGKLKVKSFAKIVEDLSRDNNLK